MCGVEHTSFQVLGKLSNPRWIGRKETKIFEWLALIKNIIIAAKIWRIIGNKIGKGILISVPLPSPTILGRRILISVRNESAKFKASADP